MYQIMIVDDNPTSLAIGKALLEPSYKIVLMKSGVQALGYLKNNPAPDLILLDLVMPGTSGLDVLQAMQDDPALHGIPVILMANPEDSKPLTEGLLLGAADGCHKPLNAALLKKKVSNQIEHLQIKREKQELRRRVAELENLVRQCAALLSGAVTDSSLL